MRSVGLHALGQEEHAAHVAVQLHSVCVNPAAGATNA